jgi:hypothetical protein
MSSTSTLKPIEKTRSQAAVVIGDVTLVKVPAEGTTRIHVRFKGSKTATLDGTESKIASDKELCAAAPRSLSTRGSGLVEKGRYFAKF